MPVNPANMHQVGYRTYTSRSVSPAVRSGRERTRSALRSDCCSHMRNNSASPTLRGDVNSPSSMSSTTSRSSPGNAGQNSNSPWQQQNMLEVCIIKLIASMPGSTLLYSVFPYPKGSKNSVLLAPIKAFSNTPT